MYKYEILGDEIIKYLKQQKKNGNKSFILRATDVNEIFDIIKEVSASGTTVLLVEQNAKKALSIADRAYVLETGKIVLEGDAKELMNDESVKKAYLGE